MLQRKLGIHAYECASQNLPGNGRPCDCDARYAYDYDSSRNYVTETLGMVFLEDWVPAADAMFAELDLTRAQVDRLMMEYAWRVKYLFTPQNFTFRQRIGLALHFLFGRHVTPRKKADVR